MAYAAYCDSFNALNGHAVATHMAPTAPTAFVACAKQLMVWDITVPSCEAFKVRRLLANCSQAGVLRCIPRLRDKTVVLEIQLPAERVQDVMHLLMTSVPSGEMGALNSWRHHLSSRGMTHGL